MIEARIGGDGVSAPYLAASDPAARLAIVDEWLVDHDLMFLEVKRDDPRPWDEFMSDPNLREFMRVGVAGDRAAAEYVSGGFACTRPEVRVTSCDRTVGSDSAVPYGDGRYFPADTVISLAEVRQLMIDFVTTGEWVHEELWCRREYMVG